MCIHFIKCSLNTIYISKRHVFVVDFKFEIHLKTWSVYSLYNKHCLVSNTKACIHDHVVTSIFEIFTKCHIFGIHITEYLPIFSFYLNEWITKVWILEIFYDTLATREETHTIVCNFHILFGCIQILHFEELKCSMLFKIVHVPLFDSRVMLKIRHSVETRHNWVLVCIFNEFYNLLRDKEDIGINCEPYIIVHLSVKWYLCRTAQNIETECLHS